MGEKGRERIEEERDGGKVGERDRGRGRRKGKESLRKKHSPICHLIFISNAYVIVHLESTELQNTHTHKDRILSPSQRSNESRFRKHSPV